MMPYKGWDSEVQPRPILLMKCHISNRTYVLRWSKQTNGDTCLLAGGATLQRDVQFWKIGH